MRSSTLSRRRISSASAPWTSTSAGRGPHQVVHAGVRDDKILRRVALDVENARDQNSRLAHYRPARLEDQPVGCASKARFNLPRQPLNVQGLFVRVTNPEAAADVEKLGLDAMSSKPLCHAEDFVQRLQERLDRQNLRADVAGDAADLEVR